MRGGEETTREGEQPLLGGRTSRIPLLSKHWFYSCFGQPEDALSGPRLSVLARRWSRLSIWREQNGVSLSSVHWLSAAWVPFFFPLDINADGLAGEQYKQVTKSVVPGVSS